ncbi:hypothetical protein [Nocardia puris]|uniref:Uncharacterized protein n=1 Tax=Nocardia puris TaxID=208602 RepID=A0A366CW76_9NOCA|nr:hypothetical protein [Nocardia puris]RBO82091.1 hypothetical protein DFR74_12546 [Nocardia puris]
MPEIPPARITIDRYTASCLPEDHPEHRHFSILVMRRRRRDTTGYAVTDGTWWYGDTDGPAHTEPVLLAESTALTIAQARAPRVQVNGFTVADVLGGGNA